MHTQAICHDRKYGLDLLRIFAMFAVVLIHVAGDTFFGIDVTSGLWFRLNLLESGLRWCVPVFVMISGALFLNPEKELSISMLWRRYIRRIVTAFVFWSAVYAVIDLVRFPRDLDLLHRCLDFAITVFLKPADHLWFVYMIVGLYMITPMLRKIVAASSKAEMQYWLILMFALGMVPEFLRHIPVAEQYAGWAIENAHLSFLLGYAFYYVAGYYFVRYQPKSDLGFYILAVLGYLVTLALTWYCSLRNGIATTAYGYLYPNTAVIAVGIFVFFTVRVEKIKFSGTVCRWLHRLSDASFGVYLSHVCVIAMLGLDRVTSAAQALGYAAVTFAISYALILLLRKIKMVRKYLS